MKETLRIEYSDQAELITKLTHIVVSLQDWQTFEQVRTRWTLGSTALTMRLRRFRDRGGEFPSVRGPSGRILKLKLTPKLIDYFESLKIN